MILSLRLRSIVLLAPVLALCSARPAAAQQNHAISIGVNYTHLRTNLLPDCDCFGLNGGGVEAQLPLNRRLALLAELTATHAGNITVNHYDLTQVTYAGGVRYFLVPFRSVRPFGDLLVGGAQASGSLSPDATNHGGSNAFLFETGGGVGIPVNSRWTLVPIRASYLLTNFSNGYDNRQNDLRLSAGIRIRIGKR